MSETEKNPLDSPLEKAVGHTPKTAQTVRRKIQTEKPVSENSMDRNPDSRPDSKPDKIPIETTETVSSAVSDDVSEDLSEDFQVAAEKLVPERNNKPSLVSGKDLRKEQERARKMMLVKELLESGYTVRDVCSELGVKKTLVEKVSKKLRQEAVSNGSPKQKYLDRPYADKLREMEAADEDSLLSGNWLTSTYQRLAKMRIEFSMMKKMGLIEGDDGSTSTTQKIDLNALLIAKAVGGSSTKEMAEMLALLKSMGLIGEPKGDDFMQKYTQMETLKDSAVAKHSMIQAQAFAAAKSETDRNFTRELINKGLETVSPLLKNIATKPANIPSPTPESGIPGPLSAPTPSELESLRLPSPHDAPPIAERIQGSIVDDSAIGYTNISKPDISKKTELR
jgi:transposase-like protein